MKLAGPRYCRETDTLTLTADRYAVLADASQHLSIAGCFTPDCTSVAQPEGQWLRH